MLVFVVASVLIMLGVLLLFLGVDVYGDQREKGRLCYALFDLLVALSTAVGFFSFLVLFGFWGKIWTECGHNSMSCATIFSCLDITKRKDTVDEHDPRGTTEHYFGHLRRAWQ
ncbi:unnamed protein product [Nippostrongylus brasiliensis]|uniref:MARVEL domain-containing protein n=1 Tax=Nippostrongylus brasiliensis TaxID=27835 RepID=A0A0N4XZJ4_NIPBR|nr:unnamed protein product [Nippostrongylus brasiliensis]